MSRVYSDYPEYIHYPDVKAPENPNSLSPEALDLARQINEHDDLMESTRRIQTRKERDLDTRFVEAVQAERPTYPLPEHVEGLRQVADMIKAGVTYPDRDLPAADRPPLTPYVRHDSHDRRINFCTLSPVNSRYGTSIWQFTPDDVETFATMITDAGLIIIDHWNCDSGVGFHVKKASE